MAKEDLQVKIGSEEFVRGHFLALIVGEGFASRGGRTQANHVGSNRWRADRLPRGQPASASQFVRRGQMTEEGRPKTKALVSGVETLLTSLVPRL